jgi:CubicO group peptidase (beta-lactamase class C family)
MQRLILPLVGLAILLAPTAAAQTSVDVETERRALGLFRAIKSGTPDTVVAYLEHHLAPGTWGRWDVDAWQQVASDLIDQVGDLELGGVVVPGPGRLRLVLERHGERAVTMGFEFEDAAPYRIAGIGLEAGGGPDEGPPLPPLELPDGAEPAEGAQAIAAWVQRLADADRFSGTVLVVHDGVELLAAAHGMASQRWGIPNRMDTRFDLGSINKSFTQVAIGQLLQAGTLSLQDRMSDLLPEYPDQSVAERITVAHLLQHRSGLGDMFTERFRRSSRALYRSASDYFPLFADEPLLFEPGEGRQYSNAGYIVLGAIIEAVSGEPYDAYVARHIFEPAGMMGAGFFERDVPTPNVAEGYTEWTGGTPEGGRRSNVFALPIKGNAAGSAQATAADLRKFDDALRTHVLLDPAYTAWYFGAEDPGAPSHATGARRAMNDMGIAGGGPGVSAILESDGALSVIVLSNYDPPTAEQMGIEIFRAMQAARR